MQFSLRLRVIWKYPLKLESEQAVLMPELARPLSVDWQDDQLTLWAEVATENPVVPRIVRIYGTGHPMCVEAGKFISTVQGAGLVWHIYVE